LILDHPENCKKKQQHKAKEANVPKGIQYRISLQEVGQKINLLCKDLAPRLYFDPDRIDSAQLARDHQNNVDAEQRNLYQAIYKFPKPIKHIFAPCYL
jgi:hypothetical protein